MTTLDYDSLNDNQRRAVFWGDGPLLVLAGPGSGKTRVLTMRVARLLKDSRGKRFKVLALTFTSKAAAEMRERVDTLVPIDRERALLTTFHSFAADVLRQHGHHVGLRPDYTILTQDGDRLAVVSDAISNLRTHSIDPQGELASLLSLLDHHFAQGYTPDFSANSFPRLPWFPQLFAEYMRQLVSMNRADFATLLWLCHRVFAEKPVIAKQIRMIFPYVCVDEFQDTNFAQYLLLREIVGPSPANLFVVADDDQILYQWNGASPERLQALRDDYQMSVVQLPESYRCPPDVIRLANSLIQHNLMRAPDKQPLQATRPPTSEGAIRLVRFASAADEVAWLPNDLRRRHLPLSGCVVLARTNRLLESAAQALRAEGISAHVVRRKSEFESVPFRWLHAALRLANARHDREQLRRLCKTWYELSGQEIRPDDLVAASALAGGDFLRAWVDAAEQQANPPTITGHLRQYLVDRLTFLLFLTQALSWFDDLEQGLGEEGFPDFVDEKQTWIDLQTRILGRFGREETTLHLFLQEMDLEPKAAAPPVDTVQCLTVHASKGLEFDHVYLIGLVEDQLPSFQARRRGDQSREMEEERRNCFVAITRVQSSLTLTFALEYGGWTKEPSRFLREMSFDLDHWEPL